MMEAANLWKCRHRTSSIAGSNAMFRSIFRQGQMCSRPVVVDGVSANDAEQLTFANCNDVIGAFTPDGPENSLAVAILPRRSTGRDDLVQAEPGSA